MTCPGCGASARSGASWCTQCHSRFTLPDPEPQVRRATERDEPPPRPQVHSRWSKSTTTFGPLGRMSWSVGVALLSVLFLFSANPFAIVPWFFFAAPMVLRSVWANGRVS